MKTLRDGLKYWLALAVAACLPMTGRAAMFQVPVAAGGGGGTVTGSVWFPGPFSVSGTNWYLASSISNLALNAAVTNIGTTLRSVSNLYSTVTILTTNDNAKTVLAGIGNDTYVKMGAGTFTVSPTLLNSNLVTGTAIGAIILQDKTNVTIEGIPGLTIIDGSSGLGEVLFLSNVFNVTIRGVTIVGYTNHNFMALPPFGGTTNQNSYLWAGVQLYNSAHVTFDNCRIERHADHGIQDKGAESIAASILNDIISTNQIIIRNSYFSDCGGMRTNAGGGLAADGTAIVSTGWIVENNTFEGNFRGVEPYNEGDANARSFGNAVIRNNIFRNNAEHDITFAGSTNSDYTLIEGNLIESFQGATYHGTNFYNGFKGTMGVGINLNGGDYHSVQRNVIRGKAGGGIFVQTSGANPVTGVSVIGNTISGSSNAINQAYGIFAGDPVYSVIFPVRQLYMAGNTISQCKTYAFYGLGLADSIIENNQLIEPLFPGAGPAMEFQSFSSAVVSNVTVRGNTIQDLGTAQMTYGIEFTSGTLANQAVGNKIQGGTTGTILNGAGTALQIFEIESGTTNQFARIRHINDYSNHVAATYATIGSGGGSNFVISTHNNAQVGDLTVTNSATIVGDGATPGALELYGTNDVPVVFRAANSNSVPVTNVVGLIERASAATLLLDMNHGHDWIVTNRITAATAVVFTNTAPGQEYTVTMIGEAASGGTARVVTFTDITGLQFVDLDAFGVAQAASKAFTLTNGNAVETSWRVNRLVGTNVIQAVTRQFTY